MSFEKVRNQIREKNYSIGIHIKLWIYIIPCRDKVRNEIFSYIDIKTRKFQTIINEYIQHVGKNKPAITLSRLF